MKNIFKRSLLAVMMLLLLGAVQAQENTTQRKTREQLAEIQAKHIAKELALDKQSSEKYVDAYCRYQKEVWAIGKRVGKRNKSTAEVKSDAQSEQEIKERFERSQKLLDLRQKYYAEYSKFLTQSQIKRAYELEKQVMSRLSKNKRPAHRK